jgi:hypothetical protein
MKHIHPKLCDTHPSRSTVFWAISVCCDVSFGAIQVRQSDNHAMVWYNWTLWSVNTLGANTRSSRSLVHHSSLHRATECSAIFVSFSKRQSFLDRSTHTRTRCEAVYMGARVHLNGYINGTGDFLDVNFVHVYTSLKPRWWRM